MVDFLKLYNDNKNFHNYVDKYSKNLSTKCTIEQALKHKTVRNTGLYYLNLDIPKN